MTTESQVTIPAARFDAVVFDMDGVVTQTATVHAAAWKALFDAFLEERALPTDEPFRPFDIEADYLPYVDGKARYDGVRDFLASRGVTLPWGAPSDPPDAQTICGLGNRKNDYFLRIVAEKGVHHAANQHGHEDTLCDHHRPQSVVDAERAYQHAVAEQTVGLR